MRFLRIFALLAASLALAACADQGAGRFGAGGGGQDAAGAGLGGIDSAGLGSAADPSSPAYFNNTVGDRVFFVVDQSTLTAEGRATLDAQARWLMTNADYRAVIEGHADEQGTREYNLALGARRASAVQQYLVAQGVAPSRLETVTFGKERPVAVCSDESCYSQNRRAVTVLALGAAGS